LRRASILQRAIRIAPGVLPSIFATSSIELLDARVPGSPRSLLSCQEIDHQNPGNAKEPATE
jgi:hypothetical protein